MADKTNVGGNSQVDLTDDVDNYDPVQNNQLGRVQKDDGEYGVADLVTHGDQDIPAAMVRDDHSLALGKKFAQDKAQNNDFYGVISSPGSIIQASIVEEKQSADNLGINDGVLENTGDEDEAVKQEELARMSEGYGYDIARGNTDGVILDSIVDDTDDGVVIGPSVGNDTKKNM